jgi:hypothetical protein
MLEVIVSFLLIFAIAAWCGLFTVFKSFQKAETAKQASDKLKLPEDSMLRRHFLAHLQSEVESALFPRPTDSVLRRHYDSLVAVELENRLANAE